MRNGFHVADPFLEELEALVVYRLALRELLSAEVGQGAHLSGASLAPEVRLAVPHDLFVLLEKPLPPLLPGREGSGDLGLIWILRAPGGGNKLDFSVQQPPRLARAGDRAFV